MDLVWWIFFCCLCGSEATWNGLKTALTTRALKKDPNFYTYWLVQLVLEIWSGIRIKRDTRIGNRGIPRNKKVCLQNNKTRDASFSLFCFVSGLNAWEKQGDESKHEDQIKIIKIILGLLSIIKSNKCLKGINNISLRKIIYINNLF